MFVIGLTGGIGTGKSTAARHLAARGAAVVDADALGHRAYAPGQAAFAQVVEAFGAEVVGADGRIDRRALGKRVFADARQLRRLTDIVWPQIRSLAVQALDAARARQADVAVLEAAVLIEAGWQSAVDEVWVVTAAPAVAAARAAARDGLDADAVRDRMRAQLGDAERIAHAHRVIDNSGSAEQFEAALDAQWRRLVGGLRPATPASSGAAAGSCRPRTRWRTPSPRRPRSG